MTTNLLHLARANGNPVIEGNRVTFVWQWSYAEACFAVRYFWNHLITRVM
ncbi:MAG: hypothetical protein IPG80_12000 [Anaerolineales bacterium]|nr:hypothetical protein [Anaerolineales bacterium]